MGFSVGWPASVGGRRGLSKSVVEMNRRGGGQAQCAGTQMPPAQWPGTQIAARGAGAT